MLVHVPGYPVTVPEVEDAQVSVLVQEVGKFDRDDHAVALAQRDNLCLDGLQVAGQTELPETVHTAFDVVTDGVAHPRTTLRRGARAESIAEGAVSVTVC